MKKSDDYGFIININSVLGHSVPFLGFSKNMYPPSKFASRAISEIFKTRTDLHEQSQNQSFGKLNLNKRDFMLIYSLFSQNLSPGSVKTEFRDAAGYPQHKSNCNYPNSLPLTPEDVSNAVMYLLSTPYSVNITELIMKPVVEQF